MHEVEDKVSEAERRTAQPYEIKMPTPGGRSRKVMLGVHANDLLKLEGQSSCARLHEGERDAATGVTTSLTAAMFVVDLGHEGEGACGTGGSRTV